MALVFEAPQKVHSKDGVAAQLDELRSHPNEWARVFLAKTVRTAYVVAHQIRHGLGYGASAGEFEAKGRKARRGGAVYARYVAGQERR